MMSATNTEDKTRRTGTDKTGQERTNKELSNDDSPFYQMISDVYYRNSADFASSLEMIEDIESSCYYHGVIGEEALLALLNTADYANACVLKHSGKDGFSLSVSHLSRKKTIIDATMITIKDGFSIKNCSAPTFAACYIAYAAEIKKKTIQRNLKTFTPSMAEIKRSSLQIADKIGEGAFGEVRVAIYRDNLVAFKIMKHNSKTKGKGYQMKLEAFTMKALACGSIVRIFGGYFNDPDYYLVMEYLAGGSLNKYIKENTNIPRNQRCCWVVDIGNALTYIHRSGFIHRDVAARNCILDIEKNIAKLADFGLSTRKEPYQLGQDEQVAIRWGAPEVLKDKRYVRGSDIWGLGLVLYEVLEGKDPYHENTLAEIRQNASDPNFRPKRESDLWDLLTANLVDLCLSQSPSKRPTAAYVCDRLRDCCPGRKYTEGIRNEAFHQDPTKELEAELNEKKLNRKKSPKLEKKKKRKAPSKIRQDS